MLGWQDRAHLAEPTVEKERFRYLREIHLLVPNAWFYCRGKKTNPTTETRPQLRIRTEANDFPIKPVLSDINI